jgi:hypothetical protein
MADVRVQKPVLLIVAAFSRNESALSWAFRKLQEKYGPVGLASTPFDFVQTKYYEATMGANLKKGFWCFENLVDPVVLPDVKLFTNSLETELSQSSQYPEPRPLNLDPALLSLGKFILATTKDQAHRIYLRDGIFAEVTLRFQASSFVPWDWTYADYRQEVVLNFLKEAREYYRSRSHL